MKKILRYIVMVIVALATSFDAMASDNYPFRGEVLRGYDEDLVKAKCDDTDLQPIEGMWYYPDEEMTVVVERCDETLKDYRIVLVSADDLSLLPGTVIGYCKPTVDNHKFKMWIYGEQQMGILENLQLCLGELSEDAQTIVIKRSEADLRIRVNFTRFLPKLLRGLSVSSSGIKEVEVPEGFVKVYPAAKGKRVRYL